TTLAVFFNTLPPALYRVVANNQSDALVNSVKFSVIAFVHFVPCGTTCLATQHIQELNGILMLLDPVLTACQVTKIKVSDGIMMLQTTASSRTSKEDMDKA
ncbi:hypothetical protein KIPB_013075, partial [Kipferlia bialata]